MKIVIFSTWLVLAVPVLHAQVAMPADATLPYREIPAYPETYTAETVAARMIDGLGFRFYWATEGLRDTDLEYRPSAEARTSEETIHHIYQLARMIFRNTASKMKVEAAPQEGETYAEKRRATLENLYQASTWLRSGKGDLNKGDKGENAGFPFWNLINGPIADALWHTGQVVSFRRASGNPFDSRVQVFYGTYKEK